VSLTSFKVAIPAGATSQVCSGAEGRVLLRKLSPANIHLGGSASEATNAGFSFFEAGVALDLEFNEPTDLWAYTPDGSPRDLHVMIVSFPPRPTSLDIQY